MCEHRPVNVPGRLLGSGALLRSLLSFGFASTADWAFTVAIGLVAFADGGAVAVGLVGCSDSCRRRCWLRQSRRKPTGCRVSACCSPRASYEALRP